MTKADILSFKIRDVNDHDLNALANIFAVAYQPENTGEHWTIESARAVLGYWFKRAPAGMKILVEDDQGIILGAIFADVKPWWNGPRLIDGEFIVQPHLQGNGLGKCLLRELLVRAPDLYGVTCFETITFEPENKHPLKWYLNLGFKRMQQLVVINGLIDDVLKQLGD